MTSGLDERLAEATVGALELFGVYLGTRLDLYARSTRVDPNAPTSSPRPRRFIRVTPSEWLEQQAVAGLIEVDDPARPGR